MYPSNLIASIILLAISSSLDFRLQFQFVLVFLGFKVLQRYIRESWSLHLGLGFVSILSFSRARIAYVIQ